MRLSKIHREILTLLQSGKSYGQVAKELGVPRSRVGANLTYAAKINGYDSITDLRKATQHAKLLPYNAKRKRDAGIYPTTSGTFRVRVWRKHKDISIGTFRSREQALAVRDAAEEQYRGYGKQETDQTKAVC